jgi:ribosome maturation factor RimP
MGANLTGKLLAIAGETITLEVDKKSVNFPITKVREAHQIWRMR